MLAFESLKPAFWPYRHSLAFLGTRDPRLPCMAHSVVVVQLASCSYSPFHVPWFRCISHKSLRLLGCTFAHRRFLALLIDSQPHTNSLYTTMMPYGFISFSTCYELVFHKRLRMRQECPRMCQAKLGGTRRRKHGSKTAEGRRPGHARCRAQL